MARNKPLGREHSITPMDEVQRKIDAGWYDRKGCNHWEDRLDWREVFCPGCRPLRDRHHQPSGNKQKPSPGQEGL